MERPTPEKPDLSEKGSPRDGQPQAMDRRLFFQLHAFTDCRDASELIAPLIESKLQAVLYADAHDARGVALLVMGQPELFVTDVRQTLLRKPFRSLTPKPELSMFGRTYSLGYEPDLQETLFDRPTRTALNPAWPWAIWYPLRRDGAFAQLLPHEQRAILQEHGIIGMAFGSADLAHDIRLASHGLDRNDNDFVIGLVGKELHPLSAIVQSMRKTRQTSVYIEHLGPFFVGKALWQSTLA
jgi:hypothetical protein